MATNENTVQTQETISTEKKDKKKSQKKSIPWTLILLASSIFITFLGGYIIKNAIGKGALTLKDSYKNAYSSAYNDAYSKIETAIYSNVEEANHVSNSQAISIGEMKEKADLEVMTVSDVAYEIENKDDNKYKITRWARIPGSCVFTVNLKASEFISDNERNTITVRIPQLKTRTTVDRSNIKEELKQVDSTTILHKAELTKVETEIVDKQVKNAYSELREKFQSDPWYEKQAKEAAVSVVTTMIKNLNNDNPDLKVYVEFMQ